MSTELILSILETMLYAILLFASYFFTKRGKLYEYAERAISMAENTYKDATKAGGKKFEYAVDLVYTQIPPALRVFFTRDMIAEIIQSVFDRMEDYAKMQIDKIATNVENEIKERFDDNGTSL